MWGRGRPTAGLVALAASACLLAAPAAADKIELTARPASSGLPSQAELSIGATLGEAAFVATVLIPGQLRACPADYAQAMAQPRAYSVLATQEPASAPPVLGSIDGVTATVPEGVFSLCGWAQPEGNTATAPASAAAGPVPLTVGGPAGSTDVHSPAAPQPQAVSIPVSYALSLAGGGIPGAATAAIGASAAPGAATGCEGSAPQGTVTLHSSPAATLSSIGPPVEGTVTFTGTLAPGHWQLCAWLLQVFAIPTSGLPNPVPAYRFGLSSGAVTVLGPPVLSRLRARPRVVPRGHGVSLDFSLDQPAAVTLQLERLAPARRGTRGRRCAANPAGGRRLCGHWVPAGSSHMQAAAGADSLRLGRPHGRSLAAGLYEVTARALSAAGVAAAPAPASFAVLR